MFGFDGRGILQDLVLVCKAFVDLRKVDRE